jgi:hypothetical protein
MRIPKDEDFTLTEEERKTAEEWAERQVEKLETLPSTVYDRFSVSFSKTSIGVIKTVKDGHTGDVLCVNSESL